MSDPTEICAKCGYTYDGHVGNTGCLYPCWTPSGQFKPLAPASVPSREAGPGTGALQVIEKAAVRFEILAGRFRGCDPERHKLSIEEAEAFAAETREAVAALRSSFQEAGAELDHLPSIEGLQLIVDDYAAAARVIHQHLAEFCDETKRFPDMIADASRKAAAEIARLRGGSSRGARGRGRRGFARRRVTLSLVAEIAVKIAICAGVAWCWYSLGYNRGLAAARRSPRKANAIVSVVGTETWIAAPNDQAAAAILAQLPPASSDNG